MNSSFHLPRQDHRSNGLTTQRPESRRTTYNPSYLQPRGPQVQFRTVSDWGKWAEVSVRFTRLRPSTTTYHLYKNFKQFGNIVVVELYEGRNGVKDGAGKIKFCPPPHTAFWENRDPAGFYWIQEDDELSTYGCRVDLAKNYHKGPNKVQSPLKPHVHYDATMKLIPTRLHFGTLEKPDVLVAMHTIVVSPGEELSFVIDMAKRRITSLFEVNFRDPQHGMSQIASNKPVKNSYAVGELDRKNQYMFQIPFTHLKTIYRVNISDDLIALVLPLQDPPQFYRKRMDDAASHSPENLLWTEFDAWYRQTDIIYNPYLLAKIPLSLHKQGPVIDIGQWIAYSFVFNTKQNDPETYQSIRSALADHNIEIEMLENLDTVPPREAKVWSLIDRAEPDGHGLSALDEGNTSTLLPFEVRYQLEVCISRNILNEYNLTEEFVVKLASIASKDPSSARNILEYAAEQDKRIYEPMSIFDDPEALAYSPKTDIPYYCAYARKATITPTTVYFSTPTVETTNRVLRRYSRENLEGRFLRVQFTDELSEGGINACADKKRNDEVFTRVYRTLYNGIKIGDRHYQFLAFGNSQFRENGAYFFCPTEHLSCSDIRQWMGNFTHIKVVAKYAARLGQCFSTTRAINGLSAPEIVMLPDVKRNGYTFTDGVGKISPFLAQVITADLGLRVNTAPSAFQFRLGGCKGILVVSPDAKDKQVHIRPSQEKFKSVYNGLEIIRWSRFSAASLNRQTITILSSLGVPDEVFLKMMSEQLEGYHDAMSDNTLAQRLLVKYIDDNQMTINIATMINNGFMTSREPFVLSLLHLWRAWSIKLLKEKAKIIVEGGAFLLGCVDETDTLRGYEVSTTAPGEECKEEELPQIFVQVPSKEDPTRYNAIEGICLVGRNPSLHPGDIRVVQAVNVEALHHLRDVIVFPRTGVRDVPSMCSGGDLDGDDFFVIWDKELQPPEWNAEPMNYDPPEPAAQIKPVQVTDLMKFFVRFMKNDSLPTIAHTHLGQSDRLDSSIKDARCLELAALHSKAVDYVKTGLPAEMPKRLRLNMWPHFMEKKYKRKEQIYHSGKVLGLLYDKVESVNFTPLYEERFDRRVLRAYALQDSMLKIVRQTKSQYDTAMRRIMAQQEIKTEFEVWTTFVLSKPRVGSDYKVQENMAVISDALKDRFRQVCIAKAGGKDFATLAPFVAGMYKVTKEELDIALAECRRTKIVNGREQPCRKMEPKFMPLISFPWLFEKELGRIATGLEGQDHLEDFIGPAAPPNHPRKRGADAVPDVDDFIQMEDGRAIHRGQELEFFHAVEDDKESVSDKSDWSETRSVGDYRDAHDLVMGKKGELVIKTEFEPKPVGQDLWSGTGVEEVVPRTELDGLINSASDPQPGTPSSSDDFYGKARAERDEKGPALALRPARRLPSAPQEPENRFSGSSFEQMADTPNFSSEDEQVKIEVKESALEKLERMMKS